MDAAQAAQQAQIQQQLMALANSPYGDSPLFRNLKQVGPNVQMSCSQLKNVLSTMCISFCMCVSV